jgi:hypothetical protein
VSLLKLEQKQIATTVERFLTMMECLNELGMDEAMEQTTAIVLMFESHGLMLRPLLPGESTLIHKEQGTYDA